MFSRLASHSDAAISIRASLPLHYLHRAESIVRSQLGLGRTKAQHTSSEVPFFVYRYTYTRDEGAFHFRSVTAALSSLISFCRIIGIGRQNWKRVEMRKVRGCKKGEKYMEDGDWNQVLSSSSFLQPAKTVFGGTWCICSKERKKRGLGWLPAIPTPLRSLTSWIRRGGGGVLSGGKPPPPFYSFTVPPVVAVAVAVAVAVGRIVLAELDGKVGREGGRK